MKSPDLLGIGAPYEKLNTKKAQKEKRIMKSYLVRFVLFAILASGPFVGKKQTFDNPIPVPQCGPNGCAPGAK